MSTELKDILLIGAGGHAKVVYDTLRCIDASLPIRVRDDNPSLVGRGFFDVRIEALSLSDSLTSVPVHIAIGDNATRKRVGEQSVRNGCRLMSVIHPSSSVSRHAEVAPGVLLAALSVVGPNAALGEGVIVNHGAVVDHDCKVAAWAHIAPNATLGGDVIVGEGALIGAGAVVLPGIEVAAWATVGAGAVVTRNVAAHTVVTGVPARRAAHE